MEAAPADLDKSSEECWFCGDCNYPSTLLNQMEDRVQKCHSNSITGRASSRSRPILNYEIRATPTAARAAARGGSLGTLYPGARSQGAQETGAIFHFWVV